MNKIINFLPVIFLLVYSLILFRPLVFEGKIPIPADTIVGLYHPWRDFYSFQYPNGIPFKNFQITDSVRQQFPWRQLALDIFKKGQLPVWNPYSGIGMPLLANLQSAVFYPLNLLYFLPVAFANAWTMQVVLQVVLGGIFMWLFLRNFKLHPFAITLGVLSWVGSGFFVAWLEWNTTVQVVIWLPLLLLAIDKIFFSKEQKFWAVVFLLSLCSSFLAGYLQPFFYVCMVMLGYLAVRIWQTKDFKKIWLFIICFLLFIAITFFQWSPTLDYIQLSARDIDQVNWDRPGWFLPWQNLVQFVAPDFFGNPATLNYTGVWNYQEFVGYVGIGSLVFAMMAVFFRRDKKTLFFSLVLLFSLLFALPTVLAILPFKLRIPYFSTSQPTRLMLLMDFSLSVLAAFGLDYFVKAKMSFKRIFLIFGLLMIIMIYLWIGVIRGNLFVARNNLYLPSVLILTIGMCFLMSFFKTKRLFILIILLVTVFDLSRFAIKFEPFSDREFLYPTTNTILFLRQQSGFFRITSLDDRIFPPNFSVFYRLPIISAYDPLYPERFGEFIRGTENSSADLPIDLGFNRIITPKNYKSKLFDLLGVKYLLTFDDLTSSKYNLVFDEGRTKVFENKEVLPRAFFVGQTKVLSQRREVLKEMIEATWDPLKEALLEEGVDMNERKYQIGKARINLYAENTVQIVTENLGEGFLVFTDQYYPQWKVSIDGSSSVIYVTDYTFRGVIVPKGKHLVTFYL